MPSGGVGSRRKEGGNGDGGEREGEEDEDDAGRPPSCNTQLNGQFESICNSDWSQMLRNIGLDVFALRRAWTLSRPADAATITVRVGGTTVRQDGSNGWTYDPVTNSINFHGSAIPQSGTRVEVTYNARCIP